MASLRRNAWLRLLIQFVPKKTIFRKHKFICSFCYKRNRKYVFRRKRKVEKWDGKFWIVLRSVRWVLTFMIRHSYLSLSEVKYKIMRELIQLEPLKGTTTGRNVLIGSLRADVEMNLYLSKLISVTPDGAAALVGRINSFVSLLECHLRDNNGINNSIKYFFTRKHFVQIWWHLMMWSKLL